MSVAHTLKTGAWVTCMACLLPGLAIGQQTIQQQQRPDRTLTERQGQGQFDRQQAQRGTANQEVEQYLANCLLSKNKAEIEISQLAQNEADDQEVKQFAQKMVQEHRQLAQKLQQVAGSQMAGVRDTSQTGARSDQARQPTQPGQQRQLDPNRPDRLTQTPGQSGTAGSQDALKQLTQIEQQITQKATEAVTEHLREKSGAEFDKAYLACQVGAHMQMKVALGVIAQQTSGELAKIARESEQQVGQHLKEAQQLMKEAEQQTGREARRQSEPQQR